MKRIQWNLTDTILHNTFFGIIQFLDDTLYFPVPLTIVSTRFHCVCTACPSLTTQVHVFVAIRFSFLSFNTMLTKLLPTC